MTVKAFIFDFDGLILDTELPNLQAWQMIYRSYGFEVPLEKYALYIGTDDHAFNPLTHLHQLAGNGFDPIRVAEKQYALFLELLASSRIMPGVMEYINFAHETGIKTAVASSSSSSWVNGHLDRLNMRTHFDSVVTAGDLIPHKPNPGVYLGALDELGITAEEAIAFEDSANGVKSARQAGVYCVAIPNSVTISMDFHESNLQIPSFLTIEPAEIIKIKELS